MAQDLTPWRIAPARPELDGQAVHLWRFPLASRESLVSLLAESERERARRLRCPEQARTFVVARGRLRQILAAYLAVEPQTLTFTCGAAGKPALTGVRRDNLEFNLAHAGGWGLCAVTRGSALGVDVEVLDRPLDAALLAARFFSAAEQRCLQDCSPRRRRRQFFRLWTRKEAWLKGKGGGFSDPVQSLDPVHLAGCRTGDGHWWLRNFAVAHNHLGALALQQPPTLILRWTIP